MRRPTAIVAEDEPLLRAELVELLGKLWPELELVCTAEDGIEALNAISTYSPDVAFVDIQMPGLLGTEVAAAASGKCHVVFVTAYDRHAVEAFERGAVDYVMKPVSAARLVLAITRVKQRIDSAPDDVGPRAATLAKSTPIAHPWLRWINASQGQNIRLITMQEISYFKADHRYTLVVTRDGESPIRKPIRDLLAQLDPDVFWQIHRGTIVNVTAIATVHRCENGTCEVRLKDRSETLSVSVPFVHLFRQM